MFIIIITLKLLFKWPTCEIHWINISLTSMSAQLNGKHWLFCTFLKFNPFFFIFMANFPFERCWSVHILKSRFKKAYVLYTHLNADNYEWPRSRWDILYHYFSSRWYMEGKILSYICYIAISHNQFVTITVNLDVYNCYYLYHNLFEYTILFTKRKQLSKT